MASVGRNQQCPCGSGRKFKFCHGVLDGVVGNAAQSLVEANAVLVQRQYQQGLGRPIISAKSMQGFRIVAVGGKPYWGTWATFHSFLEDYITEVFGKLWGWEEMKRPFEQRHPVMQWSDGLVAQARKATLQRGQIFHSPMTGPVACYLSLAYDLYCLQHNAEIQQSLVKRMKVPEQFYGARFEARVAAAFVRAGFEIAFEDERDGSTTHVEFTATSRRTGRKFSVECKRRSGIGMRLGQLLNSAQRKHARHERIVFIDLNTYEPGSGSELPPCFDRAVRNLRRVEADLLDGLPRPPTYVVLTNAPWELAPPNAQVLPFAFKVLGIAIPDLEPPADGETEDELLTRKERHLDIFDLISSMKTHTGVPATFDGASPETAFPSATGPSAAAG